MPFALIDPRGLVAQIVDEIFEVYVSLTWVDISASDPPPDVGWTAIHAGNGAWTFTAPAGPGGPGAPAISAAALDPVDHTFDGDIWQAALTS